MPKIIFKRRFDRYSGGHQKVFDYFQHFVHHPDWEPRLIWEPGSLPIDETIWAGNEQHLIAGYNHAAADAFFVAGMDWEMFLAQRDESRRPVINLIQHVRHADPKANVYPFLSEQAIRICVSHEVAAAIQRTGRVHGPVFTVPNGISQHYLNGFAGQPKQQDVYILGAKQEELAKELAKLLRARSVNVTLHDTHMPRQAVLSAMASARVSVLLPHATEGFYLPALEAMALSDLAVVPDCVGNRSFCHHGENCLMPPLELGALAAECHRALNLIDSAEGVRYRRAATSTLQGHTLEGERQAFYDILDNLDTIW